MLQEAIKFIQDTAVSAAGVTTRELFDGRQLLITQNGHRELLDVPPELRQHQVSRLSDILVAVERYAATGGSIWHDTQAVVLLIDDEPGRDRVTLPLHFAEQFCAIKKIADGVNFDQKTFVRWLRHTMNGAGVEAMVPVFRSIEFDRSGRTGGILKHGDESFGRSIEQRVANAADVPEQFAISVPCFDVADLTTTYRIELTVDIDVQNERFLVTPLPDQVTRAIQQAEDDVHNYLVRGLERLRDEEGIDNVEIFYGCP